MRPSFLELLACPECESDLTLSGSNQSTSQLDSGELGCRNGHRYPVVHGIPRFVQSELYVGNFGFEWNLHSRTQLDDSASDESERTFRAKTGFTPEQLRGKVVLDVGCGMGRFSDVASRWGATVVGVDLSSAVEAAQKNIGARDNVHIAQADVFNLPFRNGTFDYIFSIGVLHHTPDTKAAFDKLPPLHPETDNVSRIGSLRRRYRSTTRAGFRVSASGCAGSHSSAAIRRRVWDTHDWYSPKYQRKHSREEVFPWFEEQGLKDLRGLSIPISLRRTKL